VDQRDARIAVVEVGPLRIVYRNASQSFVDEILILEVREVRYRERH